MLIMRELLPQAGIMIVTDKPHSSVSRAINQSQYRYEKYTYSPPQPQAGLLDGSTTTSWPTSGLRERVTWKV